MADRLQVSELDFDQIKSNLKTFLQQQTVFQDYDFEGSGLNILLDVLAYNTHYNAYYLNMVANESFLDTALLRNSVVSHAKKLNYVPRSSTSARAIINLTVVSPDTTPSSLTLPKGYVFYSEQINGLSFKFVTLNSYTVDKTGYNFVFNNIPIYEGQLTSVTTLNSYASNPKQIFTLNDANIDTTTLVVSVKQSTSNTTTIVYDRSENDLNITANSEVYFLQEGMDGKYDIFFGDNILSKALPDGGVVTAQYLVTNGAAANYANNFITTESISGYTTTVISPILRASGGALRESVDSIKFGAPLSLLAQNRAVTKNDYIRLIQQKYPQFEAVNVWGGEENNPPIYGKVFVSAKPKLGFEISQTEKDYVKNTILKPISMLTVTPEIVDVDYNYLKVISKVYFNKAKLSTSQSQLIADVKTLISDYCSTNLNKFNSYFNFSGMETRVDAYDRSIVSNEATLFVAKKFRPDLINSDNYILDFGFELTRGTTNDNFYSSPDFTVADESGLNRQCFFEEVPSSYTGLESITVSNPGINYTSTPTVTIVGDGAGATASATIVNGKISEITVLTPGIGYTTAAIQITGGGGQLGEGLAVLQGRYGQIRISYYKTDEISSQSTKVIINKNKNDGVTGVIDYKLGKIYINNFNPIAVNNDFGDIMLHIIPMSNIIQSSLNKMLVLDDQDPTSIVVKTVAV
jgi:hypothetical protein